MTHPITWLYQQSGGILTPGAHTCYLCGTSCDGQYTVKTGIADTFNSHFLARCPSSPVMCAACHWYLAERNHPEFRKMSLIVTESRWLNWQREEMKGLLGQRLRYGLFEATYLVASLTKKKHILLQAPLNPPACTVLAVQVEEQVAYLSYETWEYLDRRFMALLAMGHNKGEILSGQLYSHTLRKHNRIADALRLSAELEPYRGSALLDLLSYVTIVDKNSEEESEKEDDDTTPDAADAAGHGRRPALDGLDGDRRRVQGALPHGHLDAVREQSRLRRTADDEPAALSQPSLW